jgi:3-dehydroquinate dehydratase type I
VEIGIEKPLIQELISNKKRTQIVLSFHDFKGTPYPNELKSLVDCTTQVGANIVKIVTFARIWEDNLKVLSLIPYAKEKKQRIVAFCMGEKGKVSRVFAPLMGAAWIYASLDKKRTSAPGQLTVFELREIWERLR